MKNHKRLLVSQCKYTKTPMSQFECFSFGHAVKGQCYTLIPNVMGVLRVVLRGEVVCCELRNGNVSHMCVSSILIQL